MATIARRWPALSLQDQTELWSIAKQGADAGAFINTLGEDQLIPLEVVPVNPALFGSDPLGRRMLIAADVSNPSTGESIEIREPFDPTDTIGQMLRYLQSLLDAWSDQSPDLAEKLQSEKDTLLEQYFLFAERRY